MDRQLLRRSINHNREDLRMLELQLSGKIETTLSNERLAELIQTKKDNIARLELKLKK